MSASCGAPFASGNNANPRQMLAVFDQFIAALKTNPNLQIAVQKRPFDIEPGKTLKNEDTPASDRKKPRSFSLQITRGSDHEICPG